MLIGQSPNWLGSPQHLVGGIGLGLFVVLAARWWGIRAPLAVALAIGAVSTVEIVIELVEYPLLFADRFHRSAYYDTLADLASTLAGGVVGALAGAWIFRLWKGQTPSGA